MRLMTGRAIFGGRFMQSAVAPVLGDFAMTAETQRRLSLAQIPRVGRSMTIVTTGAVFIGHRLMRILDGSNRCLHLTMTIEADAPGLALDQIGLIGPVRGVTDLTIAFRKGGVSGLLLFCHRQLVVAGKTELTPGGGLLEQAAVAAAMRRVTTRTLTPGKGLVLTEESLFAARLRVTGKTEIGFLLAQQLRFARFVRIVTVETQPFLGRHVRLRGVGKDFPVMAIKAKCR